MTQEVEDFVGQQRDWFKSSHSGAACSCVEVRYQDDLVQIRNSTYLLDPANDPSLQPIIDLPMAEWILFLAEISGTVPAGTNSAITVTAGADQSHTVRCTTTDIAIDYTAAEWIAFQAGVAEHEFDPVSV